MRQPGAPFAPPDQRRKQVMLGAQDSYEPICRHCFAELRKKSGNKRHLPVKNPDLFRTVRFRSIQLDTSIPSARGDCSSDKRNRKINIRNFQATEKTENTSHEAQNILNISRQCITRSAGYTPEYTGKFTIFASDRRIPTAFAAVSPTLVLPSYPPQKHIKKGPALNRAGPAIQ